MKKNIRVLLCMGLVLLCGFSGALAVAQSAQKEPEAQVDACLKSTCRSVPLRETLSAFNLPTKYARGIFGGFEQGAGFGGGVQWTTADAIPHMELRAAALVSTARARRLDLESVFDFGGRRNHVDVWFSYLQRQNDFFGIGPLTSKLTKTPFATDQRSYQASVYRDITKQVQGGLYVQVINSHAMPAEGTTDPPITDHFSGSTNAPIEQWVPGLLSTTQIFSYGGFLEYDTRDKSVDLTRGIDLYARVASRDGMNNHGEFSDYGWLEVDLDARGYIPLGSSRTSLALRSRAQFKDPKGGSQIPFYDLSYLGGREYVRGYESYRFRGNNSLIFSTELRQTVYKKTDHRGVDVVGFADSGRVWGDARSSTNPIVVANQEFRSGSWGSGLGGGLQYRHSRSLAARFELGFSKEGHRFYASMTRGF